VALDRQSIEKKDFPIGRRGYDPEAVDTHLAAIAAEVDQLRQDSRRRTETLASQASDQVRLIIEAAEQSAAEITRQAEADAKDIRTEADAEARAVREQANDQAREYVARINESSSGMLQRVDAMESELGQLLEGLRTGANRVTADLSLLESNMSDLREATSPARPAFATEDPAGADAYSLDEGDEAAVAAEDEAAGEADVEMVVIEEEEVDAGIDPDAELATVLGAEPATAVGGEGDDAEGARLVALNMALNGTPREETDRYLAEHYALADREGLLDEVYATVGE
jgi:DivIVA domain-containing protein